jgi:hypothetical protein
MRAIVALVLSLLYATAPAQITTADTNPILWPLDKVAGSTTPTCQARPLGTGSYSRTLEIKDAAGVVTHRGGWWWCTKEAEYSSRLVRVAARADYQTKIPNTSGMTIAQTFEAVWAANVTMDCNQADTDPAHELHAICTALTEAALAATDRPAPPLWIVARNGTYSTRPAYAAEVLADGSMKWTANGKLAKVLDPCACHVVAVRRGAQTMCPLPGKLSQADGFVACVRKVE